MSELTPNQYQCINPYITKIAHYNTIDSQVYLSSAINQLTSVFGNDFVIHGFYPTYYSFDGESFEIILCKGVFICDNLLLEVGESINLLLDLKPYDLERGYIIIHPDYGYLKTPVDNDLKIMLQYMSKDGDLVLPQGWAPDRNRMYFALFEFDPKLNNFVESKKTHIRIGKYTYYYRGFNQYDLLSINHGLSKHNQVYNIQQAELSNKSHNIEIGNVYNTHYNELFLYNCCFLNSATTEHDSRYLQEKVLIQDVEDSEKTYDIYDFKGNVILNETQDTNHETKESILYDQSLLNEFNRSKYSVKTYRGNIVLDEIE